MGSPDLPPDPYAALGVSKDATGAAIKTQYRKLVLKFHPDKVQDEAQKKLAADEFHKIQTAYEVVGDEDKRARYDAQCKLAELRKDVMGRHASARDRDRERDRERDRDRDRDREREREAAEIRSPIHRTSSDAPRPSPFQSRSTDRYDRPAPVYEERRPSYATHDYFEAQRANHRPIPEQDRSSKRSAPRDDRDKLKASAKEAKKAERVGREEKNKKAAKELRRNRDRKPFFVDEETSESDEYERRRRQSREDEDELRHAREALNEQARRQREDAASGLYDGDERVRKIFSQYDDAKLYMSRSSRRPESERRPSPSRRVSSKDKVAYARGKDGRPAMIRRDSNRPKTGARESEGRRNPPRENEGRRPSTAPRSSAAELAEEARPERRPPTLSQSKSSPIDIRPLGASEKQRSQSMQMDREDFIPQIRRSETMPNSPSVSREREGRRNRESAVPSKASGLRQTEFLGGMTTPGSTPEYPGPSSTANKYRYGHEYADDAEYPTPDGYRTEIREPAGPARHNRYARSPSPDRDRERPERDRERDRGRGNVDRSTARVTPVASRYATEAAASRPTAPGRTTSTTSYVITPTGAEPAAASPRPVLSRENSARVSESLLYGEVPTVRVPKNPVYKRSPPPPVEGHRYQVRPEDLKTQTGHPGYSYARRPSELRTNYARQGSPTVDVR